MRTRLMLFCMIATCVAYGLTVVQAAEPRTYQTKNMIQAGNPAILKPGGATLYRSSQGLEMRVATSGLLLNSSYTVWWVIFNNPSACVGGCGADDLSNPAVRASVLYAAGFVTGLSDTANVTAHVEAGAVPDGLDIEQGVGQVGSNVGLEPGNGFRAEVHIIVRTHGLTNIGHVDAQIGSFNGACNPTCTNVQAAPFPPVQ
jgi:hypothetical protein